MHDNRSPYRHNRFAKTLPYGKRYSKCKSLNNIKSQKPRHVSHDAMLILSFPICTIISLRVQNEKFSEEKGFILRDIEKEV